MLFDNRPGDTLDGRTVDIAFSSTPRIAEIYFEIQNKNVLEQSCPQHIVTGMLFQIYMANRQCVLPWLKINNQGFMAVHNFKLDRSIK